jgi:hypothetical protein
LLGSPILGVWEVFREVFVKLVLASTVKKDGTT